MTYIPKSPQEYTGNQVLINSDRLVFNAKTDSILLFSDKAIGFSTGGSFHFDTGPEKEGDNANKFIINSPNIYLGLEYNNTLPEQPAVLANDLIVSLDEILDLIEGIYADIAQEVSFITSIPGGLTGMNPANWRLLNKKQRRINKVRENLQDIKSLNTKLV